MPFFSFYFFLWKNVNFKILLSDDLHIHYIYINSCWEVFIVFYLMYFIRIIQIFYTICNNDVVKNKIKRNEKDIHVTYATRLVGLINVLLIYSQSYYFLTEILNWSLNNWSKSVKDTFILFFHIFSTIWNRAKLMLLINTNNINRTQKISS